MDHLETWQAKRISASLFPSVNYLLRLKERKAKVGLRAFFLRTKWP